MREWLAWWILRPFRVAAGLWRLDPDYLERLGCLKLAAFVPPSLIRRWRQWASKRHGGRSASVRSLLDGTFPDLVPIALYPDPTTPSAGRLTLLIDSLGPTARFDRTGTSLLFAVALAKHYALRLRVVTRLSPPKPSVFGSVLAEQGMDYSDNVEFEFAPARAGASRLAVSDRELVLTTSWQTTRAARKTFEPSRIIYLVQDDERLLYPSGDHQLFCTEVLCDSRLRFVVNSSVLLHDLISHGMTGIASSGVAFEPAFPTSIFYKESKHPSSKGRFVFFSNPHDQRTLFFRGLEAISLAIETDALPATDWEFHFVGADIPDVTLPQSIRPKISTTASPGLDIVSIRQADLGLSLRAAPHPGYTTLALAASGAVVVTNRYSTRQSLDDYCTNIQCSAPSVDDLAVALAAGARLANNQPQRQTSYQNARFSRHWEASFAPVLDVLSG